MLKTENLTRSFGSIVAVDRVNVEFERGNFISIVGPNGAGKTTLFNLITGGLPPSEGSVYFKDTEVTGKGPDSMTNLGMARSFQVTNVFPELTVKDNVRASIQRRGEWFNFWRHANEFEQTEQEVNELLELLELSGFAQTDAGELSHADQRMLEIAITLGTDPDVLLLDEPTAGMSQSQTSEFMTTLEQRVFPQVELIVMVEHDIDVVMEYSDRVVVLHEGAVLVEGDPDTIRDNNEVQRVYLGGEA